MYNTSDFKLHFQEVSYVPQGWYFYMCQKTEELQRIHCFTLGRCKEHIVLPPDRMERNVNHLTQDQKSGIEKYGYRYSAKAFSPHITLGRNNDEKKEEIIVMLQKKLSSLPKDPLIERITAYRMGKDGMHAETLGEVFI